MHIRFEQDGADFCYRVCNGCLRYWSWSRRVPDFDCEQALIAFGQFQQMLFRKFHLFTIERIGILENLEDDK